jgi:hypothetical protein
MTEAAEAAEAEAEAGETARTGAARSFTKASERTLPRWPVRVRARVLFGATSRSAAARMSPSVPPARRVLRQSDSASRTASRGSLKSEAAAAAARRSTKRTAGPESAEVDSRLAHASPERRRAAAGEASSVGSAP